METYKTLRELFMTLCNTEVDTAVILGHINPDGDAVGSVMGVAYYLRENFPCKFREIIPYTAPGLAKGVQNYVEQDTTFDPFALLEGRVPKDRPYVAIACDCAAPDRIAGEEWFRRAAVRVTLDHHETNTGYGDIGCIEPLSSCAEMIAQMMDSDELVPVAQRAHEQGLRTAADYLYLGILHDTRRFSHISGGRTLGVAAKLLFGGVDHDELVKTMDVRTLRECCHQGGLLAQARTAADGRVGYLCLSAAQAAELQVSYEDMKKAAYQMADCSDIRIALAALEQGPGHWRFSARTNETELDVSRYFLPFGGGEPELPDPGEVVYVSGGEVRTRRWTWRQSETGKITPETRSVLYPVDGFLDHNREEVLAARDELAELAKTLLGASVTVGFIDRDHPEFSF